MKNEVGGWMKGQSMVPDYPQKNRIPQGQKNNPDQTGDRIPKKKQKIP